MNKLRKAVRQTGIAGVLGSGLILLGIGTALAVSIALSPGASLPVPSTTAATEPTLAGAVIHDQLVPFTIKNLDGTVLCSGNLQDRVVQSGAGYDFYYRIRDTQGIGSIARFSTQSLGLTGLRVGYRTDGLGTVPPRIAARSAAPGTLVTFMFTDPPVSCAQHQESRFVLIRTGGATFNPGGSTLIITTTGPAVAVPTVMP